MFDFEKELLWPRWEFQLRREFDSINYCFKLNLVRPQISVVPATSFFGQWDPLNRVIKISSSLIQKYPWYIVVEILKHEMVHQILFDRGHTDAGHGPLFKTYCKQLGLHEAFQKSQADLDLSKIAFDKTSSWTASDEDLEAQKLLSRVEKLLALAQSGNENEALTAMKKVNELYEKFNLDRITQQSKSKNYQFFVLDLKAKRVKSTHSLICSILIEHFFVDVVYSNTYIASEISFNKTLEFFGLPENLKMAEYVFHFLDRQTDFLWQSEGYKQFKSAKFKRSYQLGLLHGFNSKLREAKQERRRSQSTQNVNTLALQLLKSDAAERDEFVRQRYPRLSSRANSSGGVYTDAFDLGHSEGQNIVLNKGIETSGSENDIKGISFRG